MDGTMKMIRCMCCIVLGVCLLMPAVLAQAQDGRNLPRSASELVAKIVGKNTAFTATGQLTVRREGTRELDLEVVYALLDGKLRCEVDA